jgi:hypothetical protein
MTDTPRRCRVCGCDDLHACVTDAGPCWWAAEDLCSACADPRHCTEAFFAMLPRTVVITVAAHLLTGTDDGFPRIRVPQGVWISGFDVSGMEATIPPSAMLLSRYGSTDLHFVASADAPIHLARPSGVYLDVTAAELAEALDNERERWRAQLDEIAEARRTP